MTLPRRTSDIPLHIDSSTLAPMPREVDPKRTRKALRLVRKLAALEAKADGAERIDPDTGEIVPEPQGVDYSNWESEFLTEVGARLDKYGSAFANLSKGRAEEALSHLQAQKLKEIAAKAKGTPRKPLRAKKPMGTRRSAP